MVEGLDPNKPLRKLNRTLLEKTIEGVTSVSAEMECMGRALLVEVKHEAYSANLLKLDQIGDMAVKVSAHRSLNFSKGVVRFRQAAEDLTNEELANDLNTSRSNKDLPQVREASRVIITKDGKKVKTGTFFLTFNASTLPKYIFLGFERFEVEPHIPLPRRCYKCQRFGHGARSCRATDDVCPICSSTDHQQNDCPNKDTPKCPNCDGAHPATSKDCPTFITEKAALRIQVETHCTLPAARKQAGQTTTEQQKSYARVLANNQADLINRNLALSEENARLREVISTLRQDNTSLQQKLEDYEKRLSNLEKSRMADDHLNTSRDGDQTTTTVGSTHSPIAVGEAHGPPVSKANMASQTEAGSTSGPSASMSPTQTETIKSPENAPAYVSRQSSYPRKKVDLNKKGPSFVSVTSPLTKAAGMRKQRKGHTAKQSNKT